MRSRVWNAANGVALIAFLFSTAVQFNDPDPLRWVALYAAAALACVLHLRRRAGVILPLLIAAVAFVWAATLLPDVIGRVRVADMFASFEMQNEVVEKAREVGGLTIVAVWMIAIALVQRIQNMRRMHDVQRAQSDQS